MSRVPDERFRIFVSHKHSDAALASLVKDEIESISPIFDCWVSGEDISSGSDWSRAIIKALEQSDLLLLLFTVPERNWDWCLYETGLFIQFAKAAEEDVRSVVSVFDPARGAPRPLSGVQGTPGDEASLVKFLTRLCTEPWEVSDTWRRGPLVKTVDAEKIKSAAAAIAQAFQARISAETAPTRAIRFGCHRVVLDAERSQEAPVKIPEEAAVVTGNTATTSFTLSLFGLAMGDAPHTWADLLERVGGTDQSWRTELDAAFAAVFREELFIPGSATFRAWDRPDGAGRVYRPVLYSVDERDAGDSTRIRIVFVLDPLPVEMVSTVS